MKNISEFIDLIKNQFEEPLELNENTVLADCDNWDSLTSFMIIDVIKENFKISISEEDLKNLSIQELYQKLV